MARILVVDDIAENLTLVEHHLRGAEFDVATANGGEAAIEACARQPFDLVLLAASMVGVDGFEVCRRLKQDARTALVPVVFLAGAGGAEAQRIAAYELGAVDYVQKPVSRAELIARLRARLGREQARQRLQRENEALRRQLGAREQASGRGARERRSVYTMTGFVGRSACVRDLTDQVSRLRETRSTVLIHGETGTGKELLARALHFDGPAADTPFVPLHCGAIAPELVESELFGHERGAFTGAQQSREGLFRAADGGTIFLDEIAETSPSVQVKLLRVLQRGEIRPVGANRVQHVDVRILAATNRDLPRLVREGRFREDLYYRLEVVALHLPPLRARLEDLPLLVEHFLRAGNRRHGRLDRPVRGVSPRAMECMFAYPWPGNVREVENVVERAFALGAGDVLQESDLPPRIAHGQQSAEASRSAHDLRSQRDAAERSAIQRALRSVAGDKLEAAQQLGMSRSTFYRRIKELGL